MSLPFLTASGKYDPVRAIGQKRERTVGQWGGLDERLITEENTFSAMRNMSSRFFPAIATREARGTAQRTITKPHGLYHKNGLFWISGTKCYYKGNEISGLTVTEGEKQVVGMGAYVCIFPDKKIYNTATGEVTAIDAKYEFKAHDTYTVSIIGDSVDTFDQEGYKIPGYRMYYPALDVTNVEQTWWKQVIDTKGFKLDTNASWSGSCATNIIRPSFYDRVSVIGNPDIIFVTLGTNDSIQNAPLGEYDYQTPYTDLSESTFRTAYIKGVKALQDLYPNAEIICISEKMDDEYKDSIQTIANQLGALFIDASSYTGGVHPVAEGMVEIADTVSTNIPDSIVDKITFSELSTDSVFCKITASGIDDVFKAHDGVKIEGVNDDQFLVDGEPSTKVVSEIGDDYIVVTAPLAKSFTGTVIMIASGINTQISGEGIDKEFKVNDVVKVIGSLDDDLNVSGKKVLSVSPGLIVIEGRFPAKSCTQTALFTFSPYYEGSDKTKIFGTDLGSSFKEGDVIRITGCTNSAYNKTLTVRMAGTNYILVDGTLATSFTQNSGLAFNRLAYKHDGMVVKRTGFTVTSGITFSRTSPDMDYVCEHDNRLWACSSENHEVYASKLGDPTNWNCYEGISTDSYTVTIGSDGDFTGCCSYMGQVLFFKEQAIHMLYGNKPSNYQLSEMHMPGVRAGSAASLCVVDQVLYYIGRSGVYRFTGATPEKVSDQIVSALTEGVAGSQDGRLYLSCLKDGARALLVYDQKYQTWYWEDNTQFRFTAFGDGKMYYIDGAGVLQTITGDSTDAIEWSIESSDLRESLLDQKYISKARFSLWMDAGAEADIFFRFDEDPLWHRSGTVHSVTPKAYNIPIVPQRCNKFRWKMEGKGQVKLLAMGITVEGGSEINGSLHSWFRK